MKFSEICTFAVIYAAYLAARRGKRSRAATAHYEVRLLENIVNLVYILKTKIYRPGVFRVFYVYEPKKRLVQAPAFVDKVVQHDIVDNLLYDRITRSFTFIVFRGTWAAIVCCLEIRGGVRPLRSGLTNRFTWA